MYMCVDGIVEKQKKKETKKEYSNTVRSLISFYACVFRKPRTIRQFYDINFNGELAFETQHC